MEEELTRLKLVDEEDDPVQDNDEVEDIEDDFNQCLVGIVLTVLFTSFR